MSRTRRSRAVEDTTELSSDPPVYKVELRMYVVAPNSRAPFDDREGLLNELYRHIAKMKGIGICPLGWALTHVTEGEVAKRLNAESLTPYRKAFKKESEVAPTPVSPGA